MNDLRNARDLLDELGINPKRGAADVLRQLNRLGIKVADQKLHTRGIRWLITESDYQRAIREHKEKSKAPEAAVDESSLRRRQIRTLARAILKLYEELGMVPDGNSDIEKLAERRLP